MKIISTGKNSPNGFRDFSPNSVSWQHRGSDMIAQAFSMKVEEPYTTSNQKQYRNYKTDFVATKDSLPNRKLIDIYNTKSLLESGKKDF